MRAALLAFAVALPGAASSEISAQTVFSHKQWQVEIVRFEDGKLACSAYVMHQGTSLSLWLYPGQAPKLQFFADHWQFGAGSTDDILVEVEGFGPWTVPYARLSQSSVHAELPDDATGRRFLAEMAAGSWLHLGNAKGEHVYTYSLAGSMAAMSALGDCRSAISEVSNPFR